MKVEIIKEKKPGYCTVGIKRVYEEEKEEKEEKKITSLFDDVSSDSESDQAKEEDEIKIDEID